MDSKSPESETTAARSASAAARREEQRARQWSLARAGYERGDSPAVYCLRASRAVDMAEVVQREGLGLQGVWVRWWAGARSSGRARAALRKLRERGASGAQRFPAAAYRCGRWRRARQRRVQRRDAAALRCWQHSAAACCSRTHARTHARTQQAACGARQPSLRVQVQRGPSGSGAAAGRQHADASTPHRACFVRAPRQTLMSRWREIRVPERLRFDRTEPSSHLSASDTSGTAAARAPSRPDAAWSRRCVGLSLPALARTSRRRGARGTPAAGTPAAGKCAVQIASAHDAAPQLPRN
jgi:hypothetical protein